MYKEGLSLHRNVFAMTYAILSLVPKVLLLFDMVGVYLICCLISLPYILSKRLWSPLENLVLNKLVVCGLDVDIAGLGCSNLFLL